MTEASDIYKILAEKHNLTVEQVREAVIFFWRKGVKRSLESMTSDEIYIPKLGSFKIKDYKLKYVIPQSLELSKRGGAHERSVEYFTMLNYRLIEIKKQIEEKEKRYNEFLKQHPNYILKSPPNMGGSEE